jgi:predicted YcjX-like family ATPase
MPKPPTTTTDEIGIALANLRDAAGSAFTPTLRLGITGLSRAGKTVFITALVHHLLNGGALPGFSPLSQGRLIGAELAEYPDASIPRFAYEQHLASLTGAEPRWPESTRRISQLRIVLRFRSTLWWRGWARSSTLNIDIIDYPGEWLLDLPLLNLSFREWSDQALKRAALAGAPAEAAAFLALASATDSGQPGAEPPAEALADAFKAYLRASRADAHALSTLPPGRFLLPGDLEGSPALTFAPLPTPAEAPHRSSLYSMLERRYEAYKDVVVRPFFRDHFARLDRQLVLVDALRALNVGPTAVADLEGALTDILACFRQGETNPITHLLSRRIDRIAFAATKADHVHSSSHDRLEAILNRLVGRAARRARFAGSAITSLALAGVRATREGHIKDLDVVIGTPEPGETIDGVTYDGRREIALFPGDLPANPETAMTQRVDLKFLRFLPPRIERNSEGAPVLPHIRMDRALDFLLGDWLR